jgi:hypothetical protein
MSHSIYLSNSANQAFQAIVLPDNNGLWADLWHREIRIVWQDFSLKTIQDFYHWYKNAHAGLWSAEQAKVVSYLFDKHGLKIAAGESKEIYNNTRANNYFDLQYWSNNKSSTKWLLFLRSKDGKHTNVFSSNENHAWISQGQGQNYQAVRSKPGQVWIADPSAGLFVFSQVRTKACNF